MNIELWDIGRIKPYPGNPRVNDAAVAAVAASLKTFGFRQPLVVDPDGVLVVGHTRWKAAQKLGLLQVPVHVATDLTPAQKPLGIRSVALQSRWFADGRLRCIPVESQCRPTAEQRPASRLPRRNGRLSERIISPSADLDNRSPRTIKHCRLRRMCRRLDRDVGMGLGQLSS